MDPYVGEPEGGEVEELARLPRPFAGSARGLRLFWSARKRSTGLHARR